MQHDPVVAAHVNDRGQRQLVKATLRGLDRASLKPDRARTVDDPREARAIHGCVHTAADMGQAHAPPIRASDHREAGGPAIHLVGLPHDRQTLRCPAAGGVRRALNPFVRRRAHG
jgi:hypothetical protein